MFYDEIKKELNLNDNINCKITIINDTNLIVEGYKKLLEYSENEIIYLTNKKKITLTGTNLKIARINRYELLIVGKINMVKIDE